MPNHDADEHKGAVEQDRPTQSTNTSLSGQLPHRTDNRLVKASDSDFPEPGSNEEHTGEPEKNPRRQNPEAQLKDQDLGERQKEKQDKAKDDPQAA